MGGMLVIYLPIYVFRAHDWGSSSHTETKPIKTMELSLLRMTIPIPVPVTRMWNWGRRQGTTLTHPSVPIVADGRPSLATHPLMRITIGVIVAVLRRSEGSACRKQSNDHRRRRLDRRNSSSSLLDHLRSCISVCAHRAACDRQRPCNCNRDNLDDGPNASCARQHVDARHGADDGIVRLGTFWDTVMLPTIHYKRRWGLWRKSDRTVPHPGCSKAS